MRIAMICRHFPPAVSGGARRPFLFARALRGLGCEVVVVAPLAGGDPHTIVVPHPQPEPSSAAPGAPCLKDRLRSLLLLPDPDIRWALRAARAPLPWRPDWVFSTSPPESAHVAGWLMSRRHGCRWVADFRDHWLEHPLHAVRRHWLRNRLERWLARRLLAAADAGIAVIPSILDEVRALGLTAPVRMIANFADPPDVPPVTLHPAEAVHVVHTGSFILSDPGRRIEPVLAAFAAAAAVRPDLHLHLVGRLRDDEIQAVTGSPAAARIHCPGPLAMEQARAYQAAADALLLVTAPDTPHVPGKLAEYRAAGRPILVHGGGGWLVAAGLEPPYPLDISLENAGKNRHSPAGSSRAADAAEAAAQVFDLLSRICKK